MSDKFFVHDSSYIDEDVKDWKKHKNMAFYAHTKRSIDWAKYNDRAERKCFK